MAPPEEWFRSWFDSPFYPLLYQNRDQAEASQGLRRILPFLQLPAGSAVLDLACGQGRYTHQLQATGFRGYGYDLSPSSIALARQGPPGPVFRVHDMRHPFPDQGFAAVFSFFTSFGYFDSARTNQLVISHIYQSLRPGGAFLLDYFNLAYLQRRLVPQESKQVDGVVFHIRRRLDTRWVEKQILIKAGEQEHRFVERVQALSPDQLASLLEDGGFSLRACWGEVAGQAFDPDRDRRLLFWAEKE